MYKLLTDAKKKSNAEIKIHVTENEFTLNGTTFVLKDLKSSNEFRPFINLAFPLSNIFKVGVKVNVDGKELSYFKSTALSPFDQHVQSYVSKNKYLNHLHPSLDMVVSMLFFPETKNFKDAVLQVIQQEDYVPIEVTTIDSSGQIIPYKPDYIGPHIPNSGIPKCLLTSEDDIVDQTGTALSFTYRDINSVEQYVDFEATVKTNKGYISHSKFDVVNGKGKLKFIPLGLSSGEKVKVQVGIGKYTDVVSKTLVVK
jgi:hypothetical protein